MGLSIGGAIRPALSTSAFAGRLGATFFMALTCVLPAASPPRPAVLSVTYQERSGRSEVTIRVTRAVEFKWGRLQNPPRIYVDAPSAVLDGRAPVPAPGQGDPVTHIRTGSPRAGVARVVLELDGSATHAVRQSPDRREFVVVVSAARRRPAPDLVSKAPSETASPEVVAADAPVNPAELNTAAVDLLLPGDGGRQLLPEPEAPEPATKAAPVMAKEAAVRLSTSPGISVPVLRGTVIDPSGAAIPNAKIVVTGPHSTAQSITTDDSGNFAVPAAAGGSYSVRASAAGFEPFQRSVNLSGSQVSTLEIRLGLATDRQEVTVAESQVAQVALDPSQNVSALSITSKDLDALSDDPDDLQAELLALAGPSVGPSGGQIFIDGFSNGQLPPKESIREVHVNANPFSAEFDRPGAGRIEIITKPGADKYHGGASGSISDSTLNSRNPFATVKPATRALQGGGNLAGPLGKRASFTVEGNHQTQDASALINADVLDPSYLTTHVNDVVKTPGTRTNLSPRLDVQLGPNTTLQSRYYYYRLDTQNAGIGGLALASKATDFEWAQHGIQLTLNRVIGSRAANQTRFQFSRFRFDDTGDAASPSVAVLGAFNGGGAPFSLNYNRNRDFEFQNNTSYTRGRNFVRFGVRVHSTTRDDYSTTNFNGSYTFTSLNAYALTLEGLAQGASMDQIRRQGGGASQYTVAGGTPLVSVDQMDAAPYIQDDFRVTPNFMLSAGARYEIQNNIGDRRGFAPRIGIAWGLGKANGSTRAPKTVLRLGYGVYYARIQPDLTLETLRQNGIAQQYFVVTSPAFYLNAPSVADLAANRQPEAIRTFESAIRAPEILQGAVTLERQLPKNMTVSVSYTNSRGIHQLRSRNINAPLPGSGIYPYGDPRKIYLYESSALFKQQQVTLNFSARVNRRISLIGSYNYNDAVSNSDDASEFPVNNYDLAGEWGRAHYDVHHRAQINGNVVLPLKLEVSPNLTFQTAPPLNITTGEDTNGDTSFNDRPAFATMAPNPALGIFATPWGVLNREPLTNPAAGSVIIPRNFGWGFGTIGVNGRISRTWTFGEQGKGRYSFTMGVQARNWINHVNPAAPVANLGSPLLGRSLSTQGGGSNPNRRLEFNLRFGF